MPTPLYPHAHVRLAGEDGNAFAIIGRVSAALRRAGERDAAKEFPARVFACKSYDEVLRLVMSTVSVDDDLEAER